MRRSSITNDGHVAHEGIASDVKAQPEIPHRHLGV
jgi:hypothetical protein